MPQLTRGAKFLLIANIAMFVITWLLQYMQGVDLTDYLALYFVKSDHFRPYQYFTYMFMHGGLFHLFFNMYALFLFGAIIESVWGTKRFMFYYLVTGLGAAVVNTAVNYFQFAPLLDAYNSFMLNPTASGLEAIAQKGDGFNLAAVYEIIDHWNSVVNDPGSLDNIRSQVTTIVNNVSSAPMLGASGAVFGLLLAFAMMFPDMKLQIIFIPIGIKAKYFVLIYGLAELFFGVNNFSGDNIAHWAHLGGLVAGIILMLIWKRYPGNNFFNT